MKEIPLEIVYRLYKANSGDTIANKYVRLNGGWATDDDRRVESNGLVARTPIYKFVFKDLSDGKYYEAAQAAAKADDPTRPYDVWVHEPFTTLNTVDPFPVYQCRYETREVSMHIVTDAIPM